MPGVVTVVKLRKREPAAGSTGGNSFAKAFADDRQGFGHSVLAADSLSYRFRPNTPATTPADSDLGILLAIHNRSKPPFFRPSAR